MSLSASDLLDKKAAGGPRYISYCTGKLLGITVHRLVRVKAQGPTMTSVICVSSGAGQRSGISRRIAADRIPSASPRLQVMILSLTIRTYCTDVRRLPLWLALKLSYPALIPHSDVRTPSCSSTVSDPPNACLASIYIN